MLDSIIAERYARSLFDLAEETGRIEKVKADMELLLQMISDSKEFRLFLLSPVIKPDKKIGLLEELLKDKVDEVTKKFYRLLARKRREKFMEGIARAFVEKYKAFKKIITVEIRTTSPLGESLRSRIVRLIEKREGVTIDLVEISDPAIIGGFIVSTGNTRYDASLATAIKKLKKEFEENLYIREI